LNDEITQVKLNVIATESVYLMQANSCGDPICESVLRAEVETLAMKMAVEKEDVEKAITFALLFCGAEVDSSKASLGVIPPPDLISDR
jgi:hypothetical protein